MQGTPQWGGRRHYSGERWAETTIVGGGRGHYRVGGQRALLCVGKAEESAMQGTPQWGAEGITVGRGGQRRLLWGGAEYTTVWERKRGREEYITGG